MAELSRLLTSLHQWLWSRVPAGYTTLREQSHRQRRGVDDAHALLLEEAHVVGQCVVVQRVVAEVQDALHTLAALHHPFQVLQLQVGDAHVPHDALVLQLEEGRQCLVHHQLQTAGQCCLELNVVYVNQVNMVDAQTLHALIDAVGDALGGVVPGVDAVLAVASHFGAQVVFVAWNVLQRLAQYRLGLVVSVVGAHVDKVNATLDGSFDSLATVLQVSLAKHAAQRRCAEADVGNFHSRTSKFCVSHFFWCYWFPVFNLTQK